MFYQTELNQTELNKPPFQLLKAWIPLKNANTANTELKISIVELYYLFSSLLATWTL